MRGSSAHNHFTGENKAFSGGNNSFSGEHVTNIKTRTVKSQNYSTGCIPKNLSPCQLKTH
ncbi:hypothetical protein [Fictibacillus norfolkensis]|uniref:hypothetical protein n=1 Tax=Fictibacillus norfolkensis TaxID=2762233 RepID=UPI001CD8E996|nr:hypothetical protein [Fictibacillus norfolkensis]